MKKFMHILGLHLDFPFIHAAHIYKGRKGIEIRSLVKQDLNDFDPENPEGFVKQLYNSNFKGPIISGMAASNFLTRLIELKITNLKHAKEAIEFQSEATSHLNPEEVLTIALFHKKTKGSVKSLLYTVPKEKIATHLYELEKLQIDPEGVSAISQGICHFMQWKFPKLKDAFIIYLGSDETACTLLSEGNVERTHAIPIGAEILLAALLKDRKKILLKKDIERAARQIDLLILKPGLNPNLATSLNELKQEIAKTYAFFHRGIENKPIIFAGRSDAFIHLKEFLTGGDENEWVLTAEEQKFMPSIGLAIEHSSPAPLDLRQGEFFPVKKRKKMGAYALSLLTLSLFLSGSIFVLGSKYFEQRKWEMCTSLPLTKSDKFFSVEDKIEHWIDSIEKSNKDYPYILKAPKAAEVLSYLSEHPLLEEFKQEGDPMDLKEIRYQLVKFPKIGSLKDPYLAKVEIEFKFKSALNARKFHETLREGDHLVNPHLEITWDGQNDSYRTSFFLNNRGSRV